MMARQADTGWHGDFLRLVAAGATYKAAVRSLGVSAATLNKHFRVDKDFRSTAARARRRWLMGPLPDTSWHAGLPLLITSGLTFDQAAAQLGRTPVTVRTHLRRFAHLRDAVNAALRAAGRRELRLSPGPSVDVMADLERENPGPIRLAWHLEDTGILAIPMVEDLARQKAAVRQWAEVLDLPVEPRDGRLVVMVIRHGVRVCISTSVDTCRPGETHASETPSEPPSATSWGAPDTCPAPLQPASESVTPSAR
ncbi:hypothetical protein [Sphaerisporangium sp. NPDC051011]|uniref:hypothetical protein n=1 Tax=Sphaerisporangium sp. NPDC051011 TaxID=3155792 RepID=UPI0033CC1326